MLSTRQNKGKGSWFMMFLVRFTINFFISFVILSITINEKTVFNHLYQLAWPVASKKMEAIKKKSKLMFFNKDKLRRNVNQEKALVEFTTGKTQHQLSSSKEKGGGGESYTDEEKEAMRKVFENQQ